MNRRTCRVQGQIDEPRVGCLVGAERDDAGDAEFSRRARCSRSNCALSRLSTTAPSDSRLSKISALASAIASMPAKNSRCTGSTVVMMATCGRTILTSAADFAGVIHPDLGDRKFRIGRAARQRQRHAPMIVERGGRGVGLALRAQNVQQRLLGRGLADRTGHGDHLALEARARGMRKFDQGRQHVVHHQQRRVGCEASPLARFRPPPAPRRPSTRHRQTHGRHGPRP